MQYCGQLELNQTQQQTEIKQNKIPQQTRIRSNTTAN
jgi:hypothetical protein